MADERATVPISASHAERAPGAPPELSARGATGQAHLGAMAHRLRHLSTSTWEAFAELASNGEGAMSLDHVDDTGWNGTRHLAAAQRSLAHAADAARHLESDTSERAGGHGERAGGHDERAGGHGERAGGHGERATAAARPPAPTSPTDDPVTGDEPQPLLEVTWICRAAEDLATVLEQAAGTGAPTDAGSDEDVLMTLAVDSIADAEHHVAVALALATKAARARTRAR